MTATAITARPISASRLVTALLATMSQAHAAQPNHSPANDLSPSADTLFDALREEHIRWIVLQALEAGGDLGASAAILLSVVNAMYPDARLAHIHAALVFLCSMELVAVQQAGAHLRACLTEAGSAVASHAADVPAGIARPSKVWA